MFDEIHEYIEKANKANDVAIKSWYLGLATGCILNLQRLGILKKEEAQKFLTQSIGKMKNECGLP